MEEINPIRKDEGLEQTILSGNKKIESTSQMSQKMENSYGARKTGPRDVFLHLLAIITLYFSTINFGVLLFQYINLWLPDPLNDFPSRIDAARGLIRWAVAALIIVFPVYLWLNRFLGKELERLPEKKELRTRKWLLYFTLFVAALVVIGDLVRLIYSFLQGELTLRFILKILVVFIIAAAVFSYYLWSLRRGETKYDKTIKIFVKIAIFVVVAATLGGFFVAGSPQAERLRKFDERRVSDLQEIQSQLIFFWQQKNHLPQNLDELKDSISGYLPPQDPENSAPYEYRVIGDLQFELCANFKTKSISQENPIVAEPIDYAKPYYPDTFNNWQHNEGYICFNRIIDPELYKKKD